MHLGVLIVNDVSLDLSANLVSVFVCYVLWVAAWDWRGLIVLRLVLGVTCDCVLFVCICVLLSFLFLWLVDLVWGSKLCVFCRHFWLQVVRFVACGFVLCVGFTLLWVLQLLGRICWYRLVCCWFLV